MRNKNFDQPYITIAKLYHYANFQLKFDIPNSSITEGSTEDGKESRYTVVQRRRDCPGRNRNLRNTFVNVIPPSIFR